MSPTNEKQRLEDLLSYEIIDTGPEFSFDEITNLASIICETPIALVSLIDESRQWFKSHHGLDVTETPREISFCGHAIHQSKIFEISNALEDERFKDNPLVIGDPRVIFYAGFPLETKKGHNLGTLCVIDHKPRKLSDSQKKALQVLGRQVVSQMELRRNNTKLLKANKQIIKQAKSIENQQAIIVNNEKMASLGLMAGGIAHEINNPLCIISLAALTIAKSIKKEETNTEKTLSACNTIDNTVQRIYKVIKGLQSVARDVEGDPATIETINKILEDALGICRTKFANEGIAIAIEGNLEAKIECRPGQISQILLNLLSNSFDAIKLNQEKWIKINIDNKNDLTTISVIDSGKGIPTNIQDTLMDPFFTTKPVGQGTGLGLSISKSLATTNNAELRIDTNCENTKFDLVFTNSVT